MEICFVILHYNAFEDTIKCIESIQSLEETSEHSVSIIIVDNCSPNGTGLSIKKRYEYVSNIDVLLLKKNIGFACGNNVGFEFASQKYAPDFIILSNNDIVIEQKNFISQIVELYHKHHFAVLGPKIYAPYKGVYQNPLRDSAYTISEIHSLVNNYERKIKQFKLIDKLHCYKILHEIKRLFKKNQGRTIPDCEEKFNVVLHGSFWVMSKEYIDVYPKGLCDKTFMYMEEDILYYFCERKHLKMMYSPDISVIHNEGASTRNALKSRAKKSIFEFENTIKSAQVLLEILQTIGEKEEG